MKTVLITGCSSGFGLCMVQLFLQKGWTVIAGLRNQENCPDFLKEPHPNLWRITLDLTNKTDISQIAELLKNQFSNHLDCLINNAGFAVVGPFEYTSEDALRLQMETNFFGLAFLTQICLPALQHARGKIINISSCFGFAGLPFGSLYSASKFAVEGLTEALFYELNPLGIQLCLVEPGWHQSHFLKNIVLIRKTEHNTYSKQQNNLAKIFKELSLKKGAAPKIVAEKVLKLASLEKLPLRVKVGLQSHVLYFITKILPRDWNHRLLCTLYNKILLQK